MPVLNVTEPDFMQDDGVRMFREAVIRFFERHAPVERVAQWRADGIVEKAFWREAGAAGLLGVSVPEEYGGAGADFRYDVVLMEETIRRDVDGWGIHMHNGILLPYILLHATAEQKQRWLPHLISGEYICAIAMTEPGAGSDLQGIKTTARRHGDGYLINGQKTFISNGQNANFIVSVCKTDVNAGHKGISLLVVETDQVEGFRRGKKLDKIGCDAQDTSELFFDDVYVPAANLLGMEAGRGFVQMMAELPKERLIMAMSGVTVMERALEETIAYVKERQVFGQRVIDFQNTQFVLAECKTEATIARVFINHCLRELLDGKLDATTAAMAKYWVTDLQCKIVDRCLQLFGGYGYINEYPIARMYRDSRIQTIYGGTNEIMKVLIARTL
jgi:acyl-CoA dehydrogenase